MYPTNCRGQARTPQSCMMPKVCPPQPWVLTQRVPPAFLPSSRSPRGTHTASGGASLGWLRLYLQKLFHSVSTRVNCRFTMTSTMAYWGGWMLREVGGSMALPHPCPPGRLPYLTVFPVQDLEGLDVPELNTLRQPFALEVKL